VLSRATHAEANVADCVIYPPLGRLSILDFSLADEFIERGRQGARQQLDRIRRDLGLG